MDPNVKLQFFPVSDPAAAKSTQGGRGQRVRAVLKDKEFLKQLFPEK
jgi:hypothetical protein